MVGRKPNTVSAHPTAGREISREEKAALAAPYRADAKAALRESELVVWDRIAPELAAVSRLGPLYFDAVCEYCRVVARLAELRQHLDDKEWTYVVEGRNGMQIKSRPEVAQANETWRQWRSLVGELGLSPAAERGIKTGQLGLPLGDDGWGDV